MHHSIMSFSSKEFYENRLQAHPTVADRLLFPGDQPFVFIDTAGCGFDEKWEGTSISNPEEARFLLTHLTSLVNHLKTFYSANEFPTIAVISPYRHQVEVLKEGVSTVPELQAIGAALSVNTIDSFQGQERDAVYISLTRSNAESIIGFLSEIRRMNVAMTRARKKLVMIGDSATLSQFPFYADLIAYTQEQHAYQSAWEFIEW